MCHTKKFHHFHDIQIHHIDQIVLMKQIRSQMVKWSTYKIITLHNGKFRATT